MARFEVVSRFKDANVSLPTRGTKDSAGYDFEVAVTTIIPSYSRLIYDMENYLYPGDTAIKRTVDTMFGLQAPAQGPALTLDELATITKKSKCKPTLVSTGVKCYLDPGTYLQLSVRSSTPLKYWLICANSVGVIDADYYNNSDNEGEIFFQMINLSPTDIILEKGDKIGQGIILPYLTTDGDCSNTERTGGFGSTSN